jgi:potassium efflux system protein
VFSSFEQLKAINKELVSWDIALKRGMDTMRMVAAIAPMQEQLKDLQRLTHLPRHNNNLRYLNGSKIITDELFNRVNEYESQLTGYFKKLHQLETTFAQLHFDRMAERQYRGRGMQQLYAEELGMLTARWEHTRASNAVLIAKLGVLQGRLTALHMKAVELEEILRFELQHFNTHLFKHPHPLLYTSQDDPYYIPVKEEISDTTSFALNLVKVYVSSLSGKFILHLILALILIFWIYHNHAFLSKKSKYAPDIKEHAPRVSKHPLAAALTMLFCFSPFLYKDLPFVIAALFILCLLISLSFLMWQGMEWKLRWRWVGLIFLFLRFDLMNLFIGISFFERWLLIGLNLGCIYILITSYFILRSRIKHYQGLLLTVIIITCSQQLLAVVLNLAGYFNAARLFSINSVFSVITAMALKLSVDILIELTYMIFIRLQHHHIIDGEQTFATIRLSTRRLLVIFAVGVWLVMFARTANIYDAIYDGLTDFLEQDRIFGSAVFTYGSILIFLFIFFLGVLVSKVIGVIIDLLGMNRNTFFGLTGLKNAKLFFRLLTLITAVVIAFAASGIPMDHFTTLPGALAVGIGIGYLLAGRLTNK